MAIYNRDRKQQQQVVTPNGKINKYILVTTTRLLLRNADDASSLGCESFHRQLGRFWGTRFRGFALFG